VADQQIFMGDSGAAPLVYPVPPAVEFLLKAVNADFDGSAASGEWLPAVVISSDSGHVIARAVDPGTPVAAGGSAEASFFPGVKRTSAGATPTALNIPWAFINSTGGEAVSHASSITLAMAGANFATNDASVFTIRAGSPPFQGLALHATGIYLVMWWLEGITNGTAAPAPSATMLELNAGTSFNDTYPNEIDLAGADAYGYIEQGTSPNVNFWQCRAVYLVGIASLLSERYLTIGATNKSPTFNIPATGGQGVFGRITAFRVSDGIADYSAFT
jgi:hypothetical protein